LQSPILPLVQDLVLIGGGHTHALILRMWGMNPLPGVRLTLVNPGPAAPYTGMLPGFVAGHYQRNDMMIDLLPLARFAGARLILDRVTAIDLATRQVRLAGREPVGFDVASVNVGATSDLPDLAGFAEFGMAAKPLGGFADAWRKFADRGLTRPNVTVIGGGVAGVELALAAAYRLSKAGAVPNITILEQAPAILPSLGKRARRILCGALDRAKVQILVNVKATLLHEKSVELSNGQTLLSDFTLSAAGARAPVWLADCGLAMTQGFLNVGPTLQTSDPAIFAAGDCAHLTDSPRPKAGVFAVRQAATLLENLRATLSGQGELLPYRPQRDYLKLISMGEKSALAEKFGLTLHGARLWDLKDRIDRKFMGRLEDLPQMALPVIPAIHALGMAQAIGTKPACGGCGAKVGAGALNATLNALPAPVRLDVLTGPGDDAAILRGADGFQVITTDHLRTVTDDPYLMAKIAAIHALGDIWAMGAAPQGALAQIILPRMSPALQARSLAEIMTAASAVFRSCGADIIGGHTSLGAELTIGFTVTGLAKSVVGKQGAKLGDALILTKPLGSGTIMAAEMSGISLSDLILGEVVAATHISMTRPMSADAEILAPVAHAMTDVTGFGLAGHLLEILNSSACGAKISLAALPILGGAEALSAAGIASTLAPENRAACVDQMDFQESPRASLLFDPQTCGGLLAAVPADQADSLVYALRKHGADAARIGLVVPGSVRLTVTG
jgi:selenide,water dikinase